jgi:hypothetical protein
VPFDPHDVKYFVHNPGFYKVYKKLIKSKDLPDGVRVHKLTRKDTTFDRRTGEFGEVVSVPLYYFQTRWDYKCGGCDENNNGV